MLLSAEQAECVSAPCISGTLRIKCDSLTPPNTLETVQASLREARACLQRGSPAVQAPA